VAEGGIIPATKTYSRKYSLSTLLSMAFEDVHAYAAPLDEYHPTS
jgi:hypothetical protein